MLECVKPTKWKAKGCSICGSEERSAFWMYWLHPNTQYEELMKPHKHQISLEKLLAAMEDSKIGGPVGWNKEWCATPTWCKISFPKQFITGKSWSCRCVALNRKDRQQQTTHSASLGECWGHISVKSSKAILVIEIFTLICESHFMRALQDPHRLAKAARTP